MDRGKNENELAEERNDDPELEEDLAKIRGGDHPEWADEHSGDYGEGSNV